MSNKIGLCKYCWEVLCSQCQENLIDDDNDHVSKSELRKWCEENIAKVEDDIQNGDFGLFYGHEFNQALKEVLEKFCKEEK